MASRLDRLLVLLDTGSSSAIRTTAAKQLAHLAAKTVRADVGNDAAATATHSSNATTVSSNAEWTELLFVVSRILPYLQSKSTDTRTAASAAISNICSLVPQWTPQSTASEDVDMDDSSPPDFPQFDVADLITSKPLLLASSGKEYSKGALSVEDSRKEAIKRLGLEFLDNDQLGDELNIDQDLAVGSAAPASESVTTSPRASPEATVKSESDDTLVKMEIDEPSRPESPVSPVSATPPVVAPVPRGRGRKPKEPPPPKEESPVPEGEVGLSARERNRLKRKRKAGNTAFVAAPPAPPQGARYNVAPAGQGSNKVRIVEKSDPSEALSPTSATQPMRADAEAVIVDPTKGGAVDPKDAAVSSNLSQSLLPSKEGTWIWDGLFRLLEVDLFSPSWEVRHGAALALREVVKVCGAHGGKRSSTTVADNARNHERWCNEFAAKLLCVFVLDRFGDFVGDQVVAPVRETVSQTLAGLLLHAPPRTALHVHGVLLQMIKQDFPTSTSTGGRTHIWEVRHAGLLGIKYEVAVRNDLVVEHPDVLRGVVQSALLGLTSQDDDVRTVAASCLLPVASNIVEQIPDELSHLLAVLWECIGSLTDDLSSSVGAVMELLGTLVTFDKVIEILAQPISSQPLSTLAPLLFPFFRHTIKNVRLAVPKTLHAFLRVPTLPRDWVSGAFFSLLIQNIVVEEREEVRAETLSLWRTTIELCSLPELVDGQLVMRMFEMSLTPIGTRLPIQLFHNPTSVNGDGAGFPEKHNVDKHMLTQDLALVNADIVIKTRITAAQAIASMVARWPSESRDELFGPLLRHYSASTSMLQKLLTGTIVEEWARESERLGGANYRPLLETSPLAAELGQTMLSVLEGTAPPPKSYFEMGPPLVRLGNECTALMQGFVSQCKLPREKVPAVPTMIDVDGSMGPDAFSLDTAKTIVNSTFAKTKEQLGRTKKKELAALDERRKKIIENISLYEESGTQHEIRVAAAYAAAVIALHLTPTQLTPIVKGIMNGIKHEENADLQTRAAVALASVVAFCVQHEMAGPPNKITQNIATFLCSDTDFVPVFEANKNILGGVLSFNSSAISGKANGAADGSTKMAHIGIARRGAQLAFAKLSDRFGSKLLDSVPKLWELISKNLLETYSDPGSNPDEILATNSHGQDILDSLTLLNTVLPTLDPSLHPRISELFPMIARSLRSRYALVRQVAAHCFSQACAVITVDAMRFLVETIMPFLGDPTIAANRQGTVELIFHVVQKLDIKALPYVIFLVVPVLGRMSDSDEDVRATATNVFASLVKMVPLEAGLPDPPGFAEDLLKRREEEREFLSQLLDGSKVVPYEIPINIKAELRKYQLEGISWLAFLAKYQLHGILCDDMGLGKTLQSITILASKHHERAEKYKATQSPDAVHLPSLVVCPPTLTGHWYHEILKYSDNLKPLMYVGSTKERTKLASSFKKHDVIITSYDVVRNDISTLSNFNWHYCILDEGHIIKNARTKLTKAVKTVHAQHRLILSGTPIQNNVLELWSLFDFLMPGFLGTEQTFNERFGKPILSSRDAKASSKASEAAALALEALHKQVLPFLLRRLKEDVLNDLPPKIIQDYHCDLSDLQKYLYDDFSKSRASNDVQTAVQSSGDSSQKHVFQALQYLRKLCNHPSLVLNSMAPDEVQSLVKKHSKSNGAPSIDDLEHAPKLQALRQLLLDCGIGTTAAAGDVKDDPLDDSAGNEAELPQHRVLIFCQMKQMIEIIEQNLFKKHMPSVTYMRLDGGTDPTKRHAIVETFNADPSIDCLLLTTHVGGLGLTLTGADTVIFVEHDWNPMKDLQAMDRAHRLGQKKVVNVYRLITKGTLEEKIMGLQRFKLNIAQSVITQQNSGLSSMGTDLVLDLFKLTTDEEDAASAKKKAEREQGSQGTQKNVLDGLEDLPTEDEYAGLDLASFMGSLGQ
ncbi:SNF2 superfamily chromatin remodeling protein [Auriculariales sp. MPI-PUGE-AT-0066]|nr:SNF2 superfamily chromatin remodeling protein [Auriculariales sp. MPI-PUGE-AT-0066]